MAVIRKEFCAIELDYDDVPEEQRKGLEAVVSIAADALSIPTPDVRFFTEESELEKRYVARYEVKEWRGFETENRVLGYCEDVLGAKGIVWLHKATADGTFPFKKAVEVAAHETRHAWQGFYFHNWRSTEELEHDANAFGEQFARELLRG